MGGTGQQTVIQSRKIRYFLAAADHLHFSAAAAALHISQPALSRSIRQLEERLGVPLFERAPKGVLLTRYGELLARRVRLMALDAEHTLAEIEAIKTGSGGTLRIGAEPVWLKVFLPPAILILQRQFPNLQVDVMAGVIDTLLPALMNGKIDVFCSSLDFPSHPELIKLHLTDLNHVIIAGNQHPLLKKENVAAEDLLNYPWITLRGDYVGQSRLGAFFGAQKLDPPKSSVAISPGAENFGFLHAGDYLTSIPTPMLASATRYGCARLRISRKIWELPDGLVYRTTNVPVVAMGALISIMKDRFRLAPKTEPGPRKRAAEVSTVVS